MGEPQSGKRRAKRDLGDQESGGKKGIVGMK
jgi:hypothetical protein